MNILITGASSGIGEALALALAAGGNRLFICGRDKARVEDAAARCRAAGASAVDAAVLDVADEAAVRGWIHAADAAAPLALVFANAGVGTGIEDEPNIRRTFATNIGGVVNTVLPVLEIFRSHPDRPRRQIVITASMAGYHGLPSCPAYSASKACVKAWGAALRGALAPEGIRVNVVCPGFVRSRITDRNTCPMPFFWEAPKAARVILARVERNVGLIAFPWPMRFVTWFGSILPERLSSFIFRSLPAKTKKVF